MFPCMLRQALSMLLLATLEGSAELCHCNTPTLGWKQSHCTEESSPAWQLVLSLFCLCSDCSCLLSTQRLQHLLFGCHLPCSLVQIY